MNDIFTDAQKMRAQHPDTFEAPTADEVASLTAPSYVKVCVGRERFWVEVTSIEKTDDPFMWLFMGVVNNDLQLTHEHGLSCNDVVEFEGRHIYGIHIE